MLYRETSKKTGSIDADNSMSLAALPTEPGLLLSTIKNASARKSRRELELKLESAERLIGQAKTLDEVLEELARLLATSLPVAFCRISLMGNDGQSFIPQAAHSSLTDFQWKPQLRESLPLALLPDGLRLSHLYYSLVSQRREPLAREQFHIYSLELGLREPLAKLLLVPLKTGNRLLAVIELGELVDDPLEGMNEDETQAIILQAPRFAVPLAERMIQVQIC